MAREKGTRMFVYKPCRWCYNTTGTVYRRTSCMAREKGTRMFGTIHACTELSHLPQPYFQSACSAIPDTSRTRIDRTTVAGEDFCHRRQSRMELRPGIWTR